VVKISKRVVCAALLLASFMVVYSGCAKKTEKETELSIENMSFRNIPGVTRAEIDAIEALKDKYGYFVYGINRTTEAFEGKDGKINGYAVMFCRWLSEMFRIQFTPKYYQWGDLRRGLEGGEIDFTGEMMFTSENREGYFMSSPTINRSIRSYRIRNSVTIGEILRTRQPRYAFLRGAVVSEDVDANTTYHFETVIVDSHPEAYRLLKSGEVDAFFGMDTAEGAFDAYGDVVSEEFYPMIFRSSCLTTHKEELRPLISVLEKVLNDDRIMEYLTSMQKRGYQQYMENRINSLLTEEERKYIQEHPVIPIGADFSNYPISFYNTHAKKWEGIYFEALDEVSKLTGLKFQPANDSNTPLLKIIENVEKGNTLILPELFQIEEYKGRFLWSDVPIISDNFAILSRSDMRNIDINDIFHLRVAIRKETIYAEMFRKVFPAHRNFIEYDTMEKTWDALSDGEVDVIFASRRRLVIYTNYYERADFKLNLVFNHTFDSFFAYNKDEEILKSIVDKALRFVNVNNMANQWIYKTYDYRSKMAAAQRPWLIGAAVSFLLVLLLVSIMLIRSRSAGKQLEKVVAQRTGALAFETSKLHSVIASIPDLMFAKDTNFKYTQCNDAFAQFIGIREEDLLGKDNFAGDWYSPEEAKRMHDSDMTVINENRVITYEEKIRSNYTGKEGIFETIKTPIMQDGVVTGLLTIKRDITRRKEMESDLSLQTSLLKTMLSSLPDAVFCKNLNFRYTLCNNYMAEIFGKKVEDILGKDDVAALGLPPETAAIATETDRKVVNEQQRIMYEEWVPCADGVTRLFETVKSPLILDGDVVGIMAIGRDVTKRKEMEEEAMAANRAKSSFLANMSHELRTPLNVVIGLTDLILEDEMTEHMRLNLVKISNAGTTLLSIVNDILDFSKIESGKLTLSPVEYYISSILNDIITLVLTRLGEKPIKFKLNIKDDLPNKLYGDDLRVKQILTNLLTNAIKYTREGSIELSVRCMREGGTVWMDAAVSDTGMGIPKDDIKSLFLDYYQVTANSNRNIEGTGLGLPITKRLVEMMGGEINVESEHGKGSTFRFRIKQGFVNDMPLGADVSEKLRTFSYSDDKRIATRKLVRVNLSYAKVLVVDDMQTNLDVASGILRKYQMQVDCLTNGLAAIDRIREENPVYNAVFMDHMMPGMDGIETADKIRALGTEYAKNVPIIALTANAISGTDKMFYAHGFQGFITKPIDVMEMDTILRKWVYDSKHDADHASDASGDQAPEAPPEDEPIEINIQGVDTKKGLALYANETDIYLPMLRSYIANTPLTLEKLKLVSSETLSDYVISVHGLKGTSAGIGAEDIRAKALELEQMSRAGDLQGVLLKNGKLIADTEVLVTNITAWLKEYDSRNVKPRQKAPDRELLAKLRQCCETYDMSGIDDVMAELDKTDYEEDADLMAWIREKIVISEIGEVAERLAQY
jgi:PAS domain S-box-containing protein